MSPKTPLMSRDPLVELSELDDSPHPGAEDTQAYQPIEKELVLESSLTIADVGDYRPVLIDYLAAVDDIRINAADVDAIDGAGLQLLAALIAQAQAKSCSVHWVAVSESLRRAALQLGIAASLQLPAGNDMQQAFKAGE